MENKIKSTYGRLMKLGMPDTPGCRHAVAAWMSKDIEPPQPEEVAEIHVAEGICHMEVVMFANTRRVLAMICLENDRAYAMPGINLELTHAHVRWVEKILGDTVNA